MLSIIKLRLLRLKDDILVFVLMTAMALGLTAVFGFSFNEYHPSVIIVDEDKSTYSERFINELKSYKDYNFIETDINTAVSEVEEGKVIIALVISEGFQNKIQMGKNINLGFLKIKDDTIILTLRELVSSTALKMAGGIKIADITAEFIKTHKPDADLEAISLSAYNNVMDSWEFKVPIEVEVNVSESDSNGGYDGMKHSMIGFSIFFSMYTMVFSISTILYDKQYKTWQRMLVSPVSRSSLLGGSMVVAYLTGAVQMVVLILGGKYLLGIDWGNSISGVLLVSGAFVFTVTSLGLMLSGIVKTQGQLGSIAPVILTSTSMLGGCMWPLEIVNNKVLLLLSEVTPQKWAMQGIESIASKGMGFQAAILPTIVLLLMGAVFFAAGVRLIKFE